MHNETKNIYLCGPTVYDSPHIGNMRPILTMDMHIRSLNALGIKTNLIHNITDIDDKIILKAMAENISEKEVASTYEEEYKELLLNYNINTPNSMPRVTDNMDGIINFIKMMVDKGIAYEADGDVYFSVEGDKDYGSLSNRELDAMRFAQEHFKETKNHPGDFALWKRTEQGITFDSPWSKGRPGWHTECVFFIFNELDGAPLDIHAGGIDLLFPHHENEASQFRMMTGKEIAKEWVHFGHLSISGTKMSKSLKNDISASSFADNIGPDVLRMMFLSSAHSAPIDFDEETIKQLEIKVSKWSKAFNKAIINNVEPLEEKSVARFISKWKFAKANEVISALVKDSSEESQAKLIYVMKLLGFAFSKFEVSSEDRKLIKEWEEAREAKEFERADALREELILRNLI